MLYELRADGTMVADWALETVKDTLPLLTEAAARVDVPAIDRAVLDRLDEEDSDFFTLDPDDMAVMADDMADDDDGLMIDYVTTDRATGTTVDRGIIAARDVVWSAAAAHCFDRMLWVSTAREDFIPAYGLSIECIRRMAV